MRRLILCSSAFGFVLQGALALAGDVSSFDRDVAPLIARHCLDCHSGGDGKGGLNLSTKAGALAGGETGVSIVAGKPDESLLWERVSSGEMPPTSKLTASEKETLRRWIAEGAAWGTDPIDPYQVTTAQRAGRDWWSLRSVHRVDPPAELKSSPWVRTPVDAFILKNLQSSGLTPRAEADRRTLIRRLYFDLTGLPPSPEEVDDFVHDTNPGAYEVRVDRLLASPEYGVRWARWWLDLARFAESNGFEYDEFRPAAYRYRDWVVNAFNRDLPYDQFAQQQLAGDVLQPSDPGAVEATGFLVAGAYDTVGQSQVSQVMRAVVRADELEDVIGTVGQTFLGLTINCARCHDHKFDPIRQSDYYRVASALDGVHHGERDLSAIDPQTIEHRRQTDRAEEALKNLEAPARQKIAAERRIAAPAPAPEPMAAWDFDRGLADRVGSLQVKLQAGAKVGPDGLRVDGKSGYASTGPIPGFLKAKTLEAWVKLDNLDQRGGGVISLQAEDGSTFDAIVFGEQEPRRWMAGSEGFNRYRSVAGAVETDAATRPVHLAITFDLDGTIRLYRDGQPYGKPYKSTGPIEMSRAQVVFGVRHLPVGGNRMLAGTIVRARLHARALAPAEVEASFASEGGYISEAELVAALDPELVARRAQLVGELRQLREASSTSARKAYAVVARQAGVMKVQKRGNPADTGETVAAGGVGSIQGVSSDLGLPPDAPEAERRRRLALWITDPKNPLFARVVVNRLWQAHFGQGLIETPSDLGFNGGKPSNPELLDWLASEVVEKRWSLKAMHRLIVTSAVYRQGSKLDPQGMAKDASDRLLWRKLPARLEAEMVRDAMLSVSGQLDLRQGGPGFVDQILTRAPETNLVTSVAADPATTGLNRRTLYRAWSRGGRSSLLDTFDCPDPSTTAPRRAVTTTPLQALSLMNNATVLYLSDAFAKRLERDAGADPQAQVDRAYRLALGRLPEPEERRRSVALVQKFGAATLARVLFNSNEFLYVD